MTAKKTAKPRPAPIDPSKVAERYLSNEDWADAFEQALTELATERASQVARVTAFLSRTRPDAEPEEVEPPKFVGPNRPLRSALSAPVEASQVPSDITLEAIVSYMQDKEAVGAAELAKHFGHDKASEAPGLAQILKTASAEGILKMSGKRRGVKYSLS